MPDPTPSGSVRNPGPQPPAAGLPPGLPQSGSVPNPNADGGAALYDAEPRPPVKSAGPSLQRPFECGPTTIADCARDQGMRDITPDKVIRLARDDFMPGMGITTSATVKVFDKMGADAVILRDPKIADLQAALKQGCKVIAWTEAPGGGCHIVRVQAITRDGKWVAIGETGAGQTFQQKSHNFYQQLNKAIVIKWRSEGGLASVTLTGRPQWRGETFLGEYGGETVKKPAPGPRTQPVPNRQTRIADRTQAALRHVGLEKRVRLIPGKEGVTVRVLTPQGAVIEEIKYIPTSNSSTRKAAELLSRATLANPADVTFVLQTVGLLELLYHTVGTLREIMDARTTLDLLEKYAEVLHDGARAAEAGDFTQVSGALAEWSAATAKLTGPVAGMGGGILWLQDRWLTTYGAEAIARMPRGYLMWLYTQYRDYIRRARAELAGRKQTAPDAPTVVEEDAPVDVTQAPEDAPAEPVEIGPLTPETLAEMGRLFGKIAEADLFVAEMVRRLAEGLRTGNEAEVTFTTNTIVRNMEARKAWAERLKVLTGIDAPPMRLPEAFDTTTSNEGSSTGPEQPREVERGRQVARESRDRAREWRALAEQARETASETTHPVAREIWEETARRHEEEARRLEDMATDLASATTARLSSTPAAPGIAARIGLLVGGVTFVVIAGLGLVGGLSALTPDVLATPAPPPAGAPVLVESTETEAPRPSPTLTDVPAAVAPTEDATATTVAEMTATTLARPNQPPAITKFVASFIPEDRTTYYDVEASDPDGDDDELNYEWSNTNPCGRFDWDKDGKLDSYASWSHPHPPCPDERFHPAIIRVVVSDDKGGQAVYEYTGGSASAIRILTPPP